jgi:hypothetical protein
VRDREPEGRTLVEFLLAVFAAKVYRVAAVEALEGRVYGHMFVTYRVFQIVIAIRFA